MSACIFLRLEKCFGHRGKQFTGLFAFHFRSTPRNIVSIYQKKQKHEPQGFVFCFFGGDAGSWTPVLKAFTGTFYMFISRLNFSHLGTWASLRLMSPKWQPTYRTLGWCCLFFWCRLPREQKTSGRHADLNYAARAKPMFVDFIELLFAFNFSIPFLRRRACDMLIPSPTSSRIQYTPKRV